MLRSSFLLRKINKQFCSANFINPKAYHYKILGLKESANFEEIQAAFNKKCQSLNVKIGPDGFENLVN